MIATRINNYWHFRTKIYPKQKTLVTHTLLKSHSVLKVHLLHFTMNKELLCLSFTYWKDLLSEEYDFLPVKPSCKPKLWFCQTDYLPTPASSVNIYLTIKERWLLKLNRYCDICDTLILFVY